MTASGSPAIGVHTHRVIFIDLARALTVVLMVSGHTSSALLRRLRRFEFFIVLGYAVQVPVSHVAELATATDQQWRSFLAIDVLQLIGVTLVAVQALEMIVRTRRAFAVSAFVPIGVTAG